MNTLEKIYSALPVWGQHGLCSLQGWLVQRRRFNSEFKCLLRQFEDYKIDGVAQLRSFMTESSKIPYYRDLFAEVGVNTTAPDITLELKKCPVLEKDFVRNHTDVFINHSYRGRSFLNHTSGTTGSGMIFPYSCDMEHRQWAVWWRYRRKHGIQFDTWCGWFGGRKIIFNEQRKPPYYRLNIPGRQVMFSAHHLSPATVESYYQTIKDRHLTWLHGYPSQLAFFTSLCIEKQFNALLEVKNITFGAENLLECQKKIIQGFFPNAKLTQHYGLSEGVANISEMPDGTLRVDDDFCYVEFLPVSKDDPSLCRIIGTGFSNLAFPLLRYDTGDLARITEKDGLRSIISIDGRNEDYITLRDGSKLGRLDHLFKDFPEVRESQIYQPSLDLLEIRIVKNLTYTVETEKRLSTILSEWFSGKINWRIVYCNKLQRTSSYKLKFVLSDIR